MSISGLLYNFDLNLFIDHLKTNFSIDTTKLNFISPTFKNSNKTNGLLYINQIDLGTDEIEKIKDINDTK